MDLQTRKIEFVQAFLRLQSEEVISQFENLMKKKSSVKEATFQPMTLKELNSRIDKSELDFKSGNYKTSSKLLEKYK